MPAGVSVLGGPFDLELAWGLQSGRTSSVGANAAPIGATFPAFPPATGWDTGRTQVEVGVPEGGETHWFTLHAPFHGPARPILEVSFGEGFRGTQTLHAVMDRQPYYATDSWVEPIPSMTHGRVWEVIREAPEGDPVGMMVEMALPMARLVEVMRLLEDMKAEGFTLDFVWRDPAPEASDD